MFMVGVGNWLCEGLSKEVGRKYSTLLMVFGVSLVTIITE